jgi:ParB family chromosome partitioning protein
MNKTLADLDIDSIVLDNRLRSDIGDLEALAASIQHLGLLFPLVVDSNNVLVSGARRLEACRRAGMKTVLAWRLDSGADSMTALEVQSAENLCREPLSNEDLERLIQTKKAAMSGRAGGLAGWVKRLFSRS